MGPAEIAVTCRSIGDRSDRDRRRQGMPPPRQRNPARGFLTMTRRRLVATGIVLTIIVLTLGGFPWGPVRKVWRPQLDRGKISIPSSGARDRLRELPEG